MSKKKNDKKIVDSFGDALVASNRPSWLPDAQEAKGPEIEKLIEAFSPENREKILAERLSKQRKKRKMKEKLIDLVNGALPKPDITEDGTVWLQTGFNYGEGAIISLKFTLCDDGSVIISDDCWSQDTGITVAPWTKPDYGKLKKKLEKDGYFRFILTSQKAWELSLKVEKTEAGYDKEFYQRLNFSICDMIRGCLKVEDFIANSPSG